MPPNTLKHWRYYVCSILFIFITSCTYHNEAATAETSPNLDEVDERILLQDTTLSLNTKLHWDFMPGPPPGPDSKTDPFITIQLLNPDLSVSELSVSPNRLYVFKNTQHIATITEFQEPYRYDDLPYIKTADFITYGEFDTTEENLTIVLEFESENQPYFIKNTSPNILISW